MELRDDPDDGVALVFQLLANLKVDLADHGWQIVKSLDFLRVLVGILLLVHELTESLGVIEWVLV